MPRLRDTTEELSELVFHTLKRFPHILHTYV